jgi:serine/threonine-protein kinase
MDLSRWPHADDLLDRALACPRADRRAFVRREAAGDSDLIAALDLVLAEDDATDAFLQPGGALTGPIADDLAGAGAPHADPDRLAPGSRFGAYDVLEAVGRGGMGEVYRARDTRLGRDVALKVIPARLASDPSHHERLEREARVLAALNHPRIASIHGLEEHDGILALVLEYVPGPTLAERLAQGRLRLDECITMGKQIASALEAAHQRGIVHRDLKPGNIKITDEGHVKVLDFGIAKAIADESGDLAAAAERALAEDLTRPEVLLGTSGYISPERARRQRSDHRADIWAFGCVLYEMVTGARAFDGRTPTDVLAQVLEREPDMARLPDRTPAALRRLLDRTLRKDPQRRLGFIGDASLDLDDAAVELTNAPVDVRRGPPRRLWPYLGVAALLGVIAGGALIWNARRPLPATLSHVALPIAENEDLVAGELPGLAVAPDGRTVVYRARRDGAIQLMRRSLGDAVASVVPGSAGAATPFFSPDGTWIGFVGATQLMKVSADDPTSTPVPIADAPGGARASWADDDAILFSTGTGRVIYRVAAAGGAIAEVTKLDAAAGDRSHESPFALPGGRTAVITIVRDQGPQVGFADLTTGSVHALTEGRQAVAIAGRLIFARGDALWSAPFDVKNGRLTGEPALVLEGVEVGSLNGTAQYALSAAGAMVYMPRRPAVDFRTPVWVQRDGSETVVPIEPASYTRASLSPDGGRIALALATVDQRDVWIHEIARGTLMRLTLDPAIDTAPIWSPDGRFVAFRSERDGGGIFLKRADGSGADERLTRSDGPSRPAHTPYAFTPDGRTLLFAELRSYSDQGIAAVELGPPPRVSVVLDGPFAEARPALSPDGRWLAYQSDESGRFEIYLRPYPDVDRARLTVSTAGGTSPRWSATGRELFFFDGRAMVAVPISPGEPLRVGHPTAMFEATRYAERLGPVYDVAPDGQRFLFLRATGPGGAQPRRADLRLVQHWLR